MSSTAALGVNWWLQKPKLTDCNVAIFALDKVFPNVRNEFLTEISRYFTKRPKAGYFINITSGYF
jgi:hypothetical protein